MSMKGHRFSDVRGVEAGLVVAERAFNRNTGMTALAAFDFVRKYGDLKTVSLADLQRRQGVKLERVGETLVAKR